MPGQPIQEFGRNERLKTGLKFFKSFTSSPGFLSRGLAMADLKQSRTMPVVREIFMILVMAGTRTSRYCLVRGVRIGSRLQLFEAVFKISSSMLASVTGSKTQNFEPVNGSKTGGSADCHAHHHHLLTIIIIMWVFFLILVVDVPVAVAVVICCLCYVIVLLLVIIINIVNISFIIVIIINSSIIIIIITIIIIIIIIVIILIYFILVFTSEKNNDTGLFIDIFFKTYEAYMLPGHNFPVIIVSFSLPSTTRLLGK